MDLVIHDRPHESLEHLLVETEALLRAEFAKELPDPHAVLLSGGSTPLPLYASIARMPTPASDTLHISYTDDRHVPRDSPESNYGHTLPMLNALGVGEHRQIAVAPDVPLTDSAARFESDLARFLDGGGTISLALLGMGDDTHTCSLFSEADLAAAEGHLAIPVTRPEPPHRVSVTPQLLERAERIVFLVAGEKKRDVLTRFVEAPHTTIAGQAVGGCGQVELWRT